MPGVYNPLVFVNELFKGRFLTDLMPAQSPSRKGLATAPWNRDSTARSTYDCFNRTGNYARKKRFRQPNQWTSV